jgi:chemotaxis protein histidine kinase CheA
MASDDDKTKQQQAQDSARQAASAAEEAKQAGERAESAATEAERAVDRALSAEQDAEAAEHVAWDAAQEADWDAKHSSAPAVQQAMRRAKSAKAEADEARQAAHKSVREARREAGVAEEAAQDGDTQEAERAAEAAKAAALKASEQADRAREASRAALDAEQEADRARLKAEEGHAYGEERVHERDLPSTQTRPALYLAEFETPEACVHAAEKVRDAGYQNWDVHTPYPVHGLDEAMGLRTTKLGIIAFIFAMIGLASAVLMIQYMNNWDYPIIVGGKPPGAFPSMIPIMFELTILLTGFGTLFGMLHLAKLPRHHHPIFNSDRFEAASNNRFFVSIEAVDPSFDTEDTRELLESLEPTHLELVEEEAQ